MTVLTSANNQLSKQEFASRVTSFLSKKTITRYNALPGRDRLKNVLLDIERYGKYNEEDGISISYNWTAYAIRWSNDTLRLNLAPEKALEAMKVKELLHLVYDLHRTCPTQIDVTHALNAQFC
jgi:hypothetical protein